MKYLLLKLTMVAALSLQLAGCGQNYPVYILELPEAPEAWVQLLGEPNWRIEWIAPNGQKQSKDILPRETVEAALPSTWANPVTASPWWRRHNLAPGLLKPAGALFPYDVSGSKLRLTWEGGVDAVFYWELAAANNENPAKIPANFDWQRFRELFDGQGNINEAVCNDPWLVDWRNVAEKTISGNFDRRRLVPQAVESVIIPLPASTWYGASPFAQPLLFAEGEAAVFKTHTGVNTWLSSEGILRCEGKVWFFTPLQLVADYTSIR